MLEKANKQTRRINFPFSKYHFSKRSVEIVISQKLIETHRSGTVLRFVFRRVDAYFRDRTFLLCLFVGIPFPPFAPEFSAVQIKPAHSAAEFQNLPL